MDYRGAYIRRSRKGSRLKQRAAAIGLLGVAGCAAVFALAMQVFSPPPTMRASAAAIPPAPAVLRTAAQVEVQATTKTTRRVYPYSIVPGGVADRKELMRAIVVDKVVAGHYAAFEAAKATVEAVGKPRGVYVSYRKGDKVYWTAKKLQLAEGETLLSDGQNEIRTRCGNRISDVPRLPVEAKGPSEEELDSSVEQVQEDAGEGGVEQVGFALEGNPAGQGYQLQTFGSGDSAQNGGASPTRSSAVMTGLRSNGPSAIWDGGTLPLTQTSKTSGDTAGTGTGGGASGTGASPTGGTPSTQLPTTLDDTALPPTDTDTNPPSAIPGTLLPPTTDLPSNPTRPDGPTKNANVPEPGSLWLGGAGVAALLAARRAKKRARN